MMDVSRLIKEVGEDLQGEGTACAKAWWHEMAQCIGSEAVAGKEATEVGRGQDMKDLGKELRYVIEEIFQGFKAGE